MFKRSCKEITALVLTGEDRRLGIWERVLLGLHLKVCQACPRFVDQVAFMRRAMGRWKQYAESDAG
jgi:hypothetical protein